MIVLLIGVRLSGEWLKIFYFGLRKDLRKAPLYKVEKNYIWPKLVTLTMEYGIIQNFINLVSIPMRGRRIMGSRNY